MRWLQIAEKDFADARRDRQLYYLIGFFGLLSLAIGYVVGENPQLAEPDTIAFALLNIMAFLAPIAALTISQGDVVGKRATGELSVLLSLPFSRLALVVGSYVGRVAVLTGVLVPAFVLGALVTVLRGAPVDVWPLVGAFLLVWALALVFAAIALGLSAVTRSTTIAAAGSFGAFLLFIFQLWSILPTGVRFLLNGLSWPRGPQPEWAAAFVQLSPFAALRNVAHSTFPDILDAFPLAPGQVGETVAWYQEPVFAALVVVAWIVLPLALGYYRFQRTDL